VSLRSLISAKTPLRVASELKPPWLGAELDINTQILDLNVNPKILAAQPRDLNKLVAGNQLDKEPLEAWHLDLDLLDLLQTLPETVRPQLDRKGPPCSR